MHATQRHLLRHVVPLLLAGASVCAAATATSSTEPGVVSGRLSAAILAEFRDTQIGPPPARRDAAPDPDVFVLPPMDVQVSRHYGTIDSETINPPTPAIPMKLGTGITEFRGRKVTVLTQRVLFIPIGFKLAW